MLFFIQQLGCYNWEQKFKNGKKLRLRKLEVLTKTLESQKQHFLLKTHKHFGTYG